MKVEEALIRSHLARKPAGSEESNERIGERNRNADEEEQATLATAKNLIRNMIRPPRNDPAVFASDKE
eukprot:CAMPEP_0175046630 /NCGR_PEP_ID=MMETSP0052_2-20121109/5138_1 /TAXON_ID=51329 ORGANISM="Polytomella parva, Strain SAG 63-3" /NCGR_SAMPLE_ID=MMETSP0052_2 /ASSEMBLY_ACC=CAM_ASM_000194 /LENGTH=67 /DNA_ID=CAMNT_0016310399 /DNA_START=1 /DNA_END=204 /DNA_ORIENTATION=-